MSDSEVDPKPGLPQVLSRPTMPLRSLALLHDYNSGDNDLISEFYVPCFKSSVRYDRAVGYFRSGILSAISEGLSEFIRNDGRMRLLCSPQFTPEDIQAITQGYKNREAVIEEALRREIASIPTGLEDSGLNLLSWLISHEKLEIQVALPETFDQDTYGIYHEKVGIFHDEEGNAVAFFGSNNETEGGAKNNYEAFDIYRSWEESERCLRKIHHFEKLWRAEAKGLGVYPFPDAAKKDLIERVRPQDRIVPRRKVSPGKDHSSHALSPDAFLAKLWPFQREAIEKLREKSFRGLFSMATGTGKTKTAVGVMLALLRKNTRLFAVVATPQTTISQQWIDEVSAVDAFDFALVADGTNTKWKKQLADKVTDYASGAIDKCIVYTTYNTLASPAFIKIIEKISGPSLLVGDEVHWAGADTFAEGLRDCYQYRLGLSATPRRHMDSEGTDTILEFFGDVVYEFSLERALSEINPGTGETFLCPYRYHPEFVALDSAELELYQEFCEKIRRQFAKERNHEPSSFLQRLLEKRQAVIVNAKAKMQHLDHLIEQLKPISKALVYCSPQQIDSAQDVLNNRGVIQHRFTGEEGVVASREFGGLSQRDYILKNFEKGDYRALVAMKCLDEGINIPSTNLALILASSGNPKQYIQRRGRLLRRAPGKKIVDIYDIIVLPYLSEAEAKKATKDEVKILFKELVRYEEFAALAQNQLDATNKVFKVKKAYGLFRRGG